MRQYRCRAFIKAMLEQLGFRAWAPQHAGIQQAALRDRKQRPNIVGLKGEDVAPKEWKHEGGLQ